MRQTRVALLATAGAIFMTCASCSLLANFNGLTPSGAGGSSDGSGGSGTHAGTSSTSPVGAGAGSSTTTNSTSNMGAGAGSGAGTSSSSMSTSMSTSSGGGGGGTGGTAVQSGTAALPAGAASMTVTIASVDTTKAALFFSLSANDPAPGNSQVSGALTDANTLTFARANAGGPEIDVQWYVVRFGSGVTVQHGSTTLGANAEQDVLIQSVHPPNAFPMISKRVSGGTYDYNDFTNAELTSSTNLALSMELSSGDAGGTVEWQVIEYANSNVQSGTVSFDNPTNTQRTATLSPSVNPAKSMLIFSNGVVLAHVTAPPSVSGFTGEITNGTTLTFSRAGSDPTAGADHLTYYLVEFTDGTKVQSGKSSFVAGDSKLQGTLTPVDLTRAVPMALGRSGRGGESVYSTDGNTGVNTFGFSFAGASTVNATRTVTTASATVNWSVVEFQ